MERMLLRIVIESVIRKTSKSERLNRKKRELEVEREKHIVFEYVRVGVC